MKLSTPRYSFCLFMQLIFLFCDLVFNCVSLFPRSRDGLLVLFIFQELFLVLAVTSMLMAFFSTYIFQAGLWSGAGGRAGCGVGVWGAYCAGTLALHAATLLLRWARHDDDSAPPALLALYAGQRCLSAWYYFVYKRCCVRAADPRLHEDVEWAARHLRQR